MVLGSLFTSLGLPLLPYKDGLVPLHLLGLLGRSHEPVSIAWPVVDMSSCVVQPLSGNSWRIPRPPAPTLTSHHLQIPLLWLF